jgi:histidine triad (HIT) family protein
MDCIFCDIVNGRGEAEMLYESENVLSFLDIRPLNYGHALVIPKKHYENFTSLPREELKDLISVTQFLSAKIKSSLNAEGFNIIVNSGRAAGQTIFHFHFHIIPRFNNDFKFKPIFKSYKNGNMKDFAERIRSAIKQ